MAKRAGFNFEQALAELEALVENLETGQPGLEEALRQFERGVKLTRQCQKALDQAEQKVRTLTGEHPVDEVPRGDGAD